MARSKAKKDRKNWAHGCTQCGWRYMSRWIDKDVNGRCHTCEHGHARTETEVSDAPVDCCYEFARPVTKHERNHYGLGGPPDMAWYICHKAEGGQTVAGCCRTFPFVHPARAPWVWDEDLIEFKDQEMTA